MKRKFARTIVLALLGVIAYQPITTSMAAPTIMGNDKNAWQEDLNFKFATNLMTQDYNRDVTIIKPDSLLDNTFHNKIGAVNKNDRYTAKYICHTLNNHNYLALYQDSKWMGFIDQKSTLSDPYSSSIKTDKIVTVKKNYSMWNDLNFKQEKSKSNDLLGIPYKVKSYRNHDNGNTYYELTTMDDVFVGYINKSGTNEVKKDDKSQLVSINAKDQDLWGDLLNSKSLNKSDKYYDGNINLTAKAIYKDNQNRDYYSLYDNNDNWQGLLETKYATPITEKKYTKPVKVINDKEVLWDNFFWKKKAEANANTTYMAKLVYELGNGKRYLSLFDGDDWAGIVEDKTVKPAIDYDQLAEKATELANLHIPYVFGGTSLKGIDCSGLAAMALEDSNQAKLPVTAAAQAKLVDMKPYEDLKRGDLVYWQSGGKISHTGIYLGDGKLAENISDFSHVTTMYKNINGLTFVGGGEIKDDQLLKLLSK